MKTKVCALIVSIIMLFSFVCSAENGYVTISDPYFTDGEEIYDFTGLSANLSYAKAENVIQLILRAVTSYAQTAAGIEIENETVSLYGDGFSAKYTMTLNDFMMLIAEATDGNVDISALVLPLFSGAVLESAENDADASLADLLSEIYGFVYRDGSQLSNAASGQVDTFLHSGMSAFVVSLDMSAEEIDGKISQFLSALDAQESFVNALSEYYPGDPNAVQNGENETAPVTSAALYEKEIKPLQLNIKGNAYYGEDDIFIEWNPLTGDKVLVPVFMEVTNTDKPSLYMNVNMDDGLGGNIVLYATIESTEDGMNDYLEIGILENDRTVALVTYQTYESAGMPVQDFYLGVTDGNALYNFSFVNSTDNETARNIHASAYLDGFEVQFSYTGAISGDFGDKNEQGTIQLATNIGIQAKVNVGFGSGSGEPIAFIPEGAGAIDIVNMSDEESMALLIDFNNLVDSLVNTLIMGVPGIARLVGAEEAQG